MSTASSKLTWFASSDSTFITKKSLNLSSPVELLRYDLTCFKEEKNLSLVAVVTGKVNKIVKIFNVSLKASWLSDKVLTIKYKSGFIAVFLWIRDLAVKNSETIMFYKMFQLCRFRIKIVFARRIKNFWYH